MIDYFALSAVAAVIREGSFERAAKALGITPSAVSQRVRSFEERLGTILIVRGEPCIATDTGRELYAHFERVQLLEADLNPGLASKTDMAATRHTLKIAVNADSLSSWFPVAAALFTKTTNALLDLVLDDEAHTANRLRNGEVLAAVTADPKPVIGCKITPLGVQPYAALASPAYVKQHFPNGVTKRALRDAPYLRFDKRDNLQTRWAKAHHGVELGSTVHWVPSMQGFMDFALAGIAWGMHPVPLGQNHVTAGRLIELPPKRLDVRLYWVVPRLHAKSLKALTDAVYSATEALRQPVKATRRKA